MSYLHVRYIPTATPRYSRGEINRAKMILLELEDKDLFLAIKAIELYYLAADEDFWQRRTMKKGLSNKPSNMTWKKYYLSQFL